MRVSYGGDADLVESWLDDGWFPLVTSWLDEAVAAQIAEPNAMVLATVDADGHPATRTVLCKEITPAGVVFYTNYGSAKGVALQAHPYASASFPWIAIQRQVTFRGHVSKVDAADTQAYWNTRPRGSRLGAWASEQSSLVSSREALEQRLTEVTARFEGDDDIPVPPDWGGFRIAPVSVEFWQGRNNRLHNRIRVDIDESGTTMLVRLQP
ncbi:pyridoxamine 5'-phosphate oxidase [Rhodococcoides trifolii]|nr:pyridoxamine 5'-phosphate oxidase [Rhodococcus trifolii]